MFDNKLHAVWKFETLVRRGIEYQLIRYYKYFTFVRREKNMRGIILWSLIIIIYLKICERVVSSEADKRFRMGAKPSNNRGFGVWNNPPKGRAPAMRKAPTANNKKLNGGNPCQDAIPNCQQLRQKQGCRKIHSKCEKVKFFKCLICMTTSCFCFGLFSELRTVSRHDSSSIFKIPKRVPKQIS